ncbi:MAG: TolC family protein [Alloprevotella sp.]|nr:TolC family protein [Alloprevotella sp.]
MIKRIIVVACLLFAGVQGINAQQLLTLDNCRSMALQNNKALQQSRAKQDVAHYTHSAATTNYLPKVSLTAGYILSGKEVSILSDNQKNALNNMGTNLSGTLTQSMQQIIARYPEFSNLLPVLQGPLQSASEALNQFGATVTDAFRTDTRNMAAGAILLKQPLYMGGKIRAYDKITRYNEDLSTLQTRTDEQETILEVDQAYWQVVSLSHRKKLAESYLATLQRLDNDVNKLLAEGFATRADELQVSVKLNEAEMLLAKVDDGLVLSRMLLCQLCGLSMDEEVLLQEELSEEIPVTPQTDSNADVNLAYAYRPEVSMLETANQIYSEKVRLVRSDFLPHLAFVGGYTMSYPSVYNSFEKKVRGDWHVGLMLSVPIWNWGEGRYKVRATQAEQRINALKLEDVREKINLQVSQSKFRVTEAYKKLTLATKSQSKAQENLRIATLGYQEGVIPVSDVLLAETAWLEAHSNKIDAEIEILLAKTHLEKSLGILNNHGK